MKRRARIAIAVSLGILALAAWIGWRQYEQGWLHEPIAALAAAESFEVPEGASLTAVAFALEKQGLLDQPGAWIRHARRSGVATRIRTGEYEFPPGTTPSELLQQLVDGRVKLYSLTIPEGWTIRQAMTAIQSHASVRVTLAGLPQREWMRRLGLGDRHPEGLFFPDTYRFPRGTTDAELLKQANARLEQELARAWKYRARDLPIDSPYEALILASIVEKETGAPDERPRIAGIFVNRLRKGMRLQTDPTVIYGMGEAFDGNLRKRDMLTDTPYNTYTRGGLPPTPIALPGRAAIEASLRPADSDSLYFVATGLGDGRHFFAATLTAHNGNVERHKANLRGGSGVQVR